MSSTRERAERIFAKVLQKRGAESVVQAAQRAKMREEKRERRKQGNQRRVDEDRKWTELSIEEQNELRSENMRKISKVLLPLWFLVRPTKTTLDLNKPADRDESNRRHKLLPGDEDVLKGDMIHLKELITPLQREMVSRLEGSFSMPWAANVINWKQWVHAFARIGYENRIPLQDIIREVYFDDTNLAYEVINSYSVLLEEEERFRVATEKNLGDVWWSIGSS